MIIIFKKVRDSLTTRLVPDYFYLYIHEQSPREEVEDRQAVSGLPVRDELVKTGFKGIIFMVPAGSGKVYVNVETIGSRYLLVKVGNKAAASFKLNGRETVEISYTVAEPSYIYIYGSDTDVASARASRMAKANDDCVKVYSYKWEPADQTGISSIDNSQSAIGSEAGEWYTIDGRKLNGKPAQKGIYIVNGRKVAVK